MQTAKPMQHEHRRVLAAVALAGGDNSRFNYNNPDAGYCLDAPDTLPSGSTARMDGTALTPYPYFLYAGR